MLDWELSTLGHPLADLAYCALAWHLPHGSALRGFVGLDLASLGLPTEAEFVERYAEEAGRPPIGESTLRFFLVFSLFRLAAIAQGVYRRGLEGNAADSAAGGFLEITRALAALGRSLAAKQAG